MSNVKIVLKSRYCVILHYPIDSHANKRQLLLTTSFYSSFSFIKNTLFGNGMKNDNTVPYLLNKDLLSVSSMKNLYEL